MTMATSGLRSQEVRALAWRAVLLDEGGLLIQQAIMEDGSVGPPKGNEYRAVPLPGRTLELLGRWRACTPKPAADDWVFFGARFGEPITRHTVLTYFRHGMTAAGVTPAGRSPHSLRHYFNSAMRKRIPDEALRELTGHRSEKMTRNYDHGEMVSVLTRRLALQAAVRPALEAMLEEGTHGSE